MIKAIIIGFGLCVGWKFCEYLIAKLSTKSDKDKKKESNK